MDLVAEDMVGLDQISIAHELRNVELRVIELHVHTT